MAKHYDTGYKELFSYPEFVQQLLEGFAPPEIAGLMDFSTLQIHNGNYITPLFEEKFEDVVWSVNVTWQGVTQEIYLYLLLEFQSSVDDTMPLRLMHYVACFYSHLLKNRTTTPQRGLPPVFPMVLYNGVPRWRAPQDIYAMVEPEPPAFLQAYQPHLRYYLVDEGAYTEQELAERHSVLSGVFGIEKASSDYASLQRAVDRIVDVIQRDPHKERVDKVVTRWLKRHLHHLHADIQLDQVHSLVEDNAMLAENLESWRQKERREGRQEGRQEGERLGEKKALVKMLNKLLVLKFGSLPAWVETQLQTATLVQLEAWSEQVLTADSLEALFNPPFPR